MRFLLWFLCFYLIYLNFAEVIENPELPFSTSMFHLNIGDRIVVKVQLDARTGLFINLSNAPKDYYQHSGENVILHLVICPDGGNSKAVASYGARKWFTEIGSVCAITPGEIGTISVLMEENRFRIEVNNVEVYYNYEFPVIFGTFLIVGRRKEDTGAARVKLLKIERNPHKPLVYLPRFRDSAGKQHLVNAIAESGRMENCSQEAIGKLHRFYMFSSTEMVCQTMDNPSESLPYFELFPHWFDACPCACFSNPDGVSILKLPSDLNITDSHKDRTTTIIIEEGSSKYDLLIHSKGQIVVEFFERPTNISHNCDLFEKPLKNCSITDSLRRLGDGDYMDIVTVTHGETMSTVFPQWLRLAYKGGGEVYMPYDLNMPASIPRRPKSHYSSDPPLTEHGNTVAEIVGMGLKQAGLVPYTIFSSPELRCVQTAAAIASRLECSGTTICVDASLADWSMWRPIETRNQWLKPEQLSYLGYPIDISYRPMMKPQHMAEEETEVQYMQRLANFYLWARRSSIDKVILVVANPAANSLVRESICDTVHDLRMAQEDTVPCTVHALRVGKEKLIHNDIPQLKQFTRTLRESIQKEMTEMEKSGVRV